MEFEGGCYCGALRYRATGEPFYKALCHCRQCLYFSGGMAALLVGMPASGFSYIDCEPTLSHNKFADVKSHREFCGQCGTHILARTDENPDLVSIKAGTMDDMTVYGMPEMALQLADAERFHALPDNVTKHQHWPWS